MSRPSLRTCRRAALGLAAAALLTACAGSNPLGFNRVSERLAGLVTPYRVEVVQGNVVTREMAERVKTGMSRSQVRELLGSPLISDAFHVDRWDYVFTIRRPGTDYQQRRVTAVFSNDALTTFQADELPSEREFVASIDTRKAGGKLPELELSEAQLAKLPPGASAPAARPAGVGTQPQGAARAYPPLEP